MSVKELRRRFCKRYRQLGLSLRGAVCGFSRNSGSRGVLLRWIRRACWWRLGGVRQDVLRGWLSGGRSSTGGLRMRRLGNQVLGLLLEDLRQRDAMQWKHQRWRCSITHPVAPYTVAVLMFSRELHVFGWASITEGIAARRTISLRRFYCSTQRREQRSMRFEEHRCGWLQKWQIILKFLVVSLLFLVRLVSLGWVRVLQPVFVVIEVTESDDRRCCSADQNLQS